MTNIKTNERELASKVAQWFNEQIKRGKYPFTSASCEPGIKVGKTTYFGDIIIWENREFLGIDWLVKDRTTNIAPGESEQSHNYGTGTKEAQARIECKDVDGDIVGEGSDTILIDTEKPENKIKNPEYVGAKGVRVGLEPKDKGKEMGVDIIDCGIGWGDGVWVTVAKDISAYHDYPHLGSYNIEYICIDMAGNNNKDTLSVTITSE